MLWGSKSLLIRVKLSGPAGEAWMGRWGAEAQTARVLLPDKDQVK